MKKWIVLIVILGAAGGGYYGWKNWRKAQDASDTPALPTTAVAQRRDIDFYVNAAGQIAPAQQVSVRPQINGKISDLPVDIGDKVKQGDLLFKLDDTELQRQRASSQTDVEAAKLQLDKAQRDYEREEKLLADKLISRQEYDDSKTTYELAKNALDRAKSNLEVIDEQLNYTVVRAPFDCTVLTRPVSIGQAVSGSGGYNSGTEVLTIADLKNLIIDAQVNQTDVPRVKLNQKVEVTIEAVPGLSVTGVVERISPQATIVNNIKGYPARISLKNADPRILPGMTANVKIPVASAANVTAVPLSAVFTERNPDTGDMEQFVYVKHGDGFEKRDVKVGVADYFYAEIQQGLSPGDVVSLEEPKNEIQSRERLVADGPSGPTPANSKKLPSGPKLAAQPSSTPTNSVAGKAAASASEASSKPATNSPPASSQNGSVAASTPTASAATSLTVQHHS